MANKTVHFCNFFFFFREGRFPLLFPFDVGISIEEGVSYRGIADNTLSQCLSLVRHVGRLFHTLLKGNFLLRKGEKSPLFNLEVLTDC